MPLLLSGVVAALGTAVWEPIKPEAEFVMEIARRLKNARADRSKRSIATDAGIDPQTLLNILKGDTWCDAPTIYRLETSLQVHLWPRRHVTSSRWARPERRDD